MRYRGPKYYGTVQESAKDIEYLTIRCKTRNLSIHTSATSIEKFGEIIGRKDGK